MNKILYILLLLPFVAMAQEVPFVNGYKTFLDNKQVDITHYFIDPDNVADIRTDKNTKEVYITRKEQTELVCLADILNELEKNRTTAIIKVNDNIIEKPETYYLENNAISHVDIVKSSGEGHMNHPTTIHITTKNKRKE